MGAVDKRNVLDDEVFTYRISKEKKVFIYWGGKQVKILKWTEAQKFINKLIGLDYKGIHKEIFYIGHPTDLQHHRERAPHP